MRKLALALGLAAALPAAAAAASPAKTGMTAKGEALEAPDGRTLYVYDADKIEAAQQGKSSCVKACAEKWPPFQAGPDAMPIGDFGVIAREGGVRQWTYKGHPLYTWSRDAGPGEVSGDGLAGNVWHVARP